MHKTLLGGALALAAALAAAPTALADPAPDTLAIIGDTPYRHAQIERFPADIAQINADPHVSRVVHLGDINERRGQPALRHPRPGPEPHADRGRGLDQHAARVAQAARRPALARGVQLAERAV